MSEEHRHILGLFGNSLDALRNDILRMSSLTVENLHNCMRGLLERDDSLCNRVIAEDEEVDQLEKRIDKEGIEIIMRFSPVASDLRRVITTMKVSNDLERISDQAVNIAKRARKMNRHPEMPESALLEPLYRMAAEQFDTSMNAFRDGDVKKSLTLEEMDNSLDKAQKKLIKDLTHQAEADAERVGGYINLIFIARFLERIGDRAVNIAEDCVYAASAVDIRHGGQPPTAAGS